MMSDECMSEMNANPTRAQRSISALLYIKEDTPVRPLLYDALKRTISVCRMLYQTQVQARIP